MEYTVELSRLTSAGEHVRAEAVFVQLVGDGRGIARINACYRDLAEAFLARAAALALPEGRYTASLTMTAAPCETGITVTLVWQLCRRGRPLERSTACHRWLLPRGYLLPERQKVKK